MFETNLLILVMILISYFYINLLGGHFEHIWILWRPPTIYIIITAQMLPQQMLPDVSQLKPSKESNEIKEWKKKKMCVMAECLMEEAKGLIDINIG